MRKLLVVTAISLSSLVSQTTFGDLQPVGRVQLANSARRLANQFHDSKRWAPNSNYEGMDTAIACMSAVMLKWYQLYRPVIQSMPADYQEQNDVKALNDLAAETADSMDNFFNVYRPGLNTAIQNEMSARMAQNKWPAQPAGLSVDDVKESEYAQNLQACSDKSFIASVNGRIPAALEDQIVSRSVYRDVAVGECGGYCIAVPTERRLVNETLNYRDWILDMRQGAWR